jgi:hypothetical protein
LDHALVNAVIRCTFRLNFVAYSISVVTGSHLGQFLDYVTIFSIELLHHFIKTGRQVVGVDVHILLCSGMIFRQLLKSSMKL